jgi:hypothetical protein
LLQSLLSGNAFVSARLTWLAFGSSPYYLSGSYAGQGWNMLQLSKWAMVFSLVGLVFQTVPMAAENVDRPDIHVGDRWSWVHTNGMVNEQDWTKIEDVVSISQTEIRTRIRKKGTPNNIIAIYSLDMNPIDTSGERYQPNLTRYVFPFQTGKKWSGEFDKMLFSNGKHGKFFAKAEVKGLEKVKVPAGEFDAYKIVLTYDATGTDEDARTGHTVETVWYAPDVKNFVKSETVFTRDGQVRSQDIFELLEYSLR